MNQHMVRQFFSRTLVGKPHGGAHSYTGASQLTLPMYKDKLFLEVFAQQTNDTAPKSSAGAPVLEPKSPGSVPKDDAPALHTKPKSPAKRQEGGSVGAHPKTPPAKASTRSPAKSPPPAKASTTSLAKSPPPSKASMTSPKSPSPAKASTTPPGATARDAAELEKQD